MGRRVALGHWFREGSRWTLLLALIYAPWDYGGTTEQGIRFTTYLLSLAVSVWIFGVVLGRPFGRLTADGRDRSTQKERLTSVSPILLLLTLLLLALGWWMAVNAKTIYDSDLHMFVPMASLLPRAQGSIDQALSVAWMWRATTLLGTVLLVADAVRERRWLLRVWITIAATGGSIALLGLMQKASGAPMIFWQPVEKPVTTFFATFFYHGNAGAFLNLTLPVTLGMALRSVRRSREPVLRALWLAIAIVSLVAIFANTSRMGQFLGAAIAAAIFARFIPAAIRSAGRIEWTTGLAGLLAISFALYAVLEASQLDRSVKRWEKLGETVSRDARWSVAGVAIRALPDAGWSGFGPGTFEVIFPFYTAGGDERLQGRWRYLHQDYLQTLMEWGWLGGGLMGCVFFGGMMVAGGNLWRASAQKRRRRKFQQAECEPPHLSRLRSPQREAAKGISYPLLLALVILGLFSVALHALVDFPLQVASIQLYVATYVGICWGSSAWKR